jgi:hypothetical protein
MVDRIGFQIGEDFGYYGRKLPENASESMVAGYREAKNGGKSRKHDRYINKWLQIRANAYLRGKAFSDKVTPEYLKSIDEEYCPVTGVKLTHGEEKDTDWSIDRLCNDFDYIPTNLLVMSTKANKAKGSKSADEIMNIAASVKEVDGLTHSEWERMADLMKRIKRRLLVDSKEYEGAENISTDDLASMFLQGEKPHDGISYPTIAALQIYLIEELTKGRKELPEIDNFFHNDKVSRKLFHKLWARLKKREPHYLPDEQYRQWSNQKTLFAYIDWLVRQKDKNTTVFLTTFSDVEKADPLSEIQKNEQMYSLY